jgi:hypothetical protein
MNPSLKPFNLVARDTDGAALLELALALPVLALLLVLTTDYGLERAAEMQVLNAASAGAEFAVNKGCNTAGIRSAASNSVATGHPWLVSNLNVNVTAYCACGTGTGGLVVTGTDAPQCGGEADVCDGGFLAPAYASISASASYTPLVPAFWSASPVTITQGAVVRTTGRTANCSG